MNINKLPFELLSSFNYEDIITYNNYSPYSTINNNSDYKKVEFEKNNDKCYVKLKNKDLWLYLENNELMFNVISIKQNEFFITPPLLIWIHYMKKPTFILYIPSNTKTKYNMFFLIVIKGKIYLTQEFNKATIFYYDKIEWSHFLNSNKYLI